MKLVQAPLHLDARTFRLLLEQQGPSLGLWRAAEVAALRQVSYERPLLDLGCGDGFVSSLIFAQIDIGLDPDHAAIERAANRGVYARFEVVPAERMTLPDESIATVVSNSVLEHLPELDHVLYQIARVLRPGGRLVFTCPTEAFSGWLAFPWGRYAAWRNRQLCHLNLWPLEWWRVHLEQVGLEIEEVRPYLHHGWVWLWDALELLQQLWIGRRRLMGIFWRRLPAGAMTQLAEWAARQDLSAPAPGGGRLIIARKLAGDNERIYYN